MQHVPYTRLAREGNGFTYLEDASENVVVIEIEPANMLVTDEKRGRTWGGEYWITLLRQYPSIATDAELRQVAREMFVPWSHEIERIPAAGIDDFAAEGLAQPRFTLQIATFEVDEEGLFVGEHYEAIALDVATDDYDRLMALQLQLAEFAQAEFKARIPEQHRFPRACLDSVERPSQLAGDEEIEIIGFCSFCDTESIYIVPATMTADGQAVELCGSCTAAFRKGQANASVNLLDAACDALRPQSYG